MAAGSILRREATEGDERMEEQAAVLRQYGGTKSPRRFKGDSNLWLAGVPAAVSSRAEMKSPANSITILNGRTRPFVPPLWLVVSLFAAASVVEAQQIYFTNDASGNLVRSYSPNAPALAILRQPVSLVAPTNDTVVFSVLAQGAAPLTYQWQFNSNNIAATADTLFLTNITLSDFGAYRVIVSDPLGSVTSSNALLQLDSDRDGMADSWEITYFG